MEKDTYGSKIRNYLTPLYNINELIEGYYFGEIEEQMFLELIKKVNLNVGLSKLLKLSFDKLLEENYYDDERD
jgi:hypothetical protein